MDRKEIVDYYSRKDVQEAILSCSKDKEVGVMIGSFFGKRPDVLEYPGDVGRLGRQGGLSPTKRKVETVFNTFINI